MYSAVPLKRGRCSLTLLQRTPHRSPIGASYGVSVVSLQSDICSATAIAVPYVTS